MARWQTDGKFTDRAKYYGVIVGPLTNQVNALDREIQEWLLVQAMDSGLTVSEFARVCIVDAFIEDQKAAE